MGTYHEPTGSHAPAAHATLAAPVPPTVLFAIPASEQHQYAGDHFTRLFVHTTADAIDMLARRLPRLVVVDWDEEQISGRELCQAASVLSSTSVLVTTRNAANASLAIKAGAHAVLLKPFFPNLLAARIGRTLRETATARGVQPCGINRSWPQLSCPECHTSGAVSFDFSSHRRMWLACLACDHAWIGPRLE